jgi:hypothetical protein
MFLRLASHYREAYSMMGGGWYDATDITQGMSVKHVIFRVLPKSPFAWRYTLHRLSSHRL